MRNKARKLAVIFFVCSAALPQATAAQDGSGELDDMAVWADAHGISREAAAEIFAETTLIHDFMVRNDGNPAFGAIWPTYNPYEVHVRFAQPATNCTSDSLPELDSLPLDSVLDVTPATSEPEPAVTVETPTDSSAPVPIVETTSTAPVTADSTSSTSVLPDPSTSSAPVATGFRKGASADPGCELVRIQREDLEGNVRELEQSIESAVSRHEGGASHAEVMSVVQAFQAGLFSFGYKADRPHGVINVFSRESADAIYSIIRPEFIVVTSPPPPAEDLAVQGGTAPTSLRIREELGDHQRHR